MTTICIICAAVCVIACIVITAVVMSTQTTEQKQFKEQQEQLKQRLAEQPSDFVQKTFREVTAGDKLIIHVDGDQDYITTIDRPIDVNKDKNLRHNGKPAVLLYTHFCPILLQRRYLDCHKTDTMEVMPTYKGKPIK